MARAGVSWDTIGPFLIWQFLIPMVRPMFLCIRYLPLTNVGRWLGAKYSLQHLHSCWRSKASARLRTFHQTPQADSHRHLRRLLRLHDLRSRLQPTTCEQCVQRPRRTNQRGRERPELALQEAHCTIPPRQDRAWRRQGRCERILHPLEARPRHHSRPCEALCVRSIWTRHLQAMSVMLDCEGVR